MKKAYSLFLLLCSIVILSALAVVKPSKITVVAAANLKGVLDSIVSAYRVDNPGVEVSIIYGASGKLFEQISNDAPFDVFLSADMEYPNRLRDRNLTSSNVKMYAIGQLAIWSKKMNPSKEKWNCLLDPSVKRIAIANPITAPYGAKAVESMKYYNVYDKVKSKLVFGENITQVAQFATTGAADIAIVALSLALSPAMKKEGGSYYILPEDSHKPLEQGCVVLKNAQGNSTAFSFYNYLSSKKVLEIFNYYGYLQKRK